MKYRSVFDIIGPVMIGPSSSHTAGAVRIGQLARLLFGGEPERADIHFYGSFARTYRGHATDVAVLAGILGFDTFDPQIPDSFHLAEERGLQFQFHEEEEVPAHPNTVRIVLKRGGQHLTVVGISVGGGIVSIVQVDAFSLRLSGESPALLIFHQDAYGTIAAVTRQLALSQINISQMEVSRSERGSDALMVIETDQPVPMNIVKEIEAQHNIRKVVQLNTAV